MLNQFSIVSKYREDIEDNISKLSTNTCVFLTNEIIFYIIQLLFPLYNVPNSNPTNTTGSALRRQLNDKLFQKRELVAAL